MKIPALPGFEQAAFQKYVKNTGWLLVGQLLSLVVGFIIARYLGPYAFCDLSFADAFAALFAAVGTLGLDSFIIREIIQHPDKREEILCNTLVIGLSVHATLISLCILSYFAFCQLSTN